jgi:hypothetical protein
VKTVAAILVEQRKPLVLDEVELPTLGYGQVLVEIAVSRICGSQIGEIDGVKGSDRFLPHLLGHEGCGAVEAALEEKFAGAAYGKHITKLLDEIRPGLEQPDPALSAERQLDAAVEQNVRHVLRGILDTPEGQARLAEGKMKAVGAVFEMSTGEVRFLD